MSNLLQERAKEFVSKIASGTSQEMDYYANLLVEFTNETTKELEKENAELKKKNTKLQQACHKGFMRWREAKKDALYFDSSLQKQIQATLKLQKENAELKEINEGYNRNRDKLIAMGFPTFKSCKEYSGKLTNLQKENTELKTRVKNQKSFLERIRAKFELGEIDRKEIEGYLESDQFTNAKELILKLYNAGRDVLMCPKEKKAYDNLSNAINDRRIEQFLKEIEK